MSTSKMPSCLRIWLKVADDDEWHRISRRLQHYSNAAREAHTPAGRHSRAGIAVLLRYLDRTAHHSHAKGPLPREIQIWIVMMALPSLSAYSDRSNLRWKRRLHAVCQHSAIADLVAIIDHVSAKCALESLLHEYAYGKPPQLADIVARNLTSALASLGNDR